MKTRASWQTQGDYAEQQLAHDHHSAALAQLASRIAIVVLYGGNKQRP